MRPISTFIIVFLCAVQLPAKTINKHIQKSFNVNEDTQFYLKHGDGEVEITPWNKDVIDVDVVYRATFAGIHRLDPDDFEVEFEQRRDKISVIGHEPRVIGFGGFRVSEYKYTIKAPVYVALETEGVDGDVYIEERQDNIKSSNVDGDITIVDVDADYVNVSSVDGDLDLKSISADIECQTVDGSIELENLDNVHCKAKSVDGDINIKYGSGEFSTHAVDGDIALLRVSAIRLDAHTTDGSITLDLNDVDEMECRIRTGDGDVRIQLEEGTSTALKINTGDGRIRTNLSPISNMQTDDNYFSGQINDGRGLIEVRTGDGNVEIVER